MINMIFSALLPEPEGAGTGYRGTGCMGTAGAMGAAAKGVPHAAQNCAPGGSSVPHFAQ
jgi:hypothetical protein